MKWERADEPTVRGTAINKALFDQIDAHLVPRGLISLWSGSVSNIPTGWLLCDGTNGTPDLRDRFIVGAGNEYNIGDTGGEKEHTLTIEEMPEHNHDFRAYSGSSTGGAQTILRVTGSGGSAVQIDSMRCSRSTTDGLINNTGGGQPFDNRPPYYALAYIMKS